MTIHERAGIICSLLNFKPVSRQDADNFDAVVKEIEEAQREAEVNLFIQKGPKAIYDSGFRAAKEKAKGIAEKYCKHYGCYCARGIGEMEP